MVISMPSGTCQCLAMPSRIASTVAGSISDGVPPPMKMLVTVLGPESACTDAISSRKAATKRGWSTGWWRTWLLKSQ
ncbi:hypothetical protein AB7M37_003178 [Sinorhizobium fredii]